MQSDHYAQLRQAHQKASQLFLKYEERVAAATNPAQRRRLEIEKKRVQQRLYEFEGLLSAYGVVVESVPTQQTIEQQSITPQRVRNSFPLPLAMPQSAEHVPPAGTDPEQLKVILERLALPRWFTNNMLSMLLVDLKMNGQQQLQAVHELLIFRQIETRPGSDRYYVPEFSRANILKRWQESDRREERDDFILWSKALANYSAKQASTTESEIRRNEWRYEQLYHLVVDDPSQAMQLMRAWFVESVEQRFDLNQGYCWLRPLEERRDLLAEQEKAQTPTAEWTVELTQLREYLAIRAFWTEEWFRTINYQERAELKRQLEEFFHHTGDSVSWLLHLYAQGGYGKTATIQWLLSRSLVAHRYLKENHYLEENQFVCARFDYDRLSTNRQIEVFQQPSNILKLLAENLNAQRFRKIEALQRLSESHSDQIGHFTLLLRETYGNRKVVLFIDTLEVLLENVPDPDQALIDLLRMLSRIRTGGGSIPGYKNLYVVLSGRRNRWIDYHQALRAALLPPGAEQNTRTQLPFIEMEVSGFTFDEGWRYLTEKRKLAKDQELLNAVLEKAREQRPEQQTHAATDKEPKIVPLKLAQYADLLQEVPTISADEIRDIDDIDYGYLVKRILDRIQTPALHWLLRYLVIFRRPDAKAAEMVLMPFLALALEGHTELDDPDLDPVAVREVLAASRQRAGKSVDNIKQLFDQLSRYSWVDRQGDYIKIHPEVWKPQLRIVAQQKIFTALQLAAFNHYIQRINDSASLQQQAEDLREAIFHVVRAGQEGVALWRQQADYYCSGPGLMLWTLVDETFFQHTSPWQNIPLSDDDRLRAYLNLASVLLDEKDQPSPLEPLVIAETAIKNAFDIVTRQDVEQPYRFSTYLLNARITLAQHKPSEALRITQQCLQEATTSTQQAETLVIQGRAEAANSQWSTALTRLRSAYKLVKETLSHNLVQTAISSVSKLLSPVYRSVLLTLIEFLSNSSDWRSALPLLEETQRAFPNDPEVLARAAYIAFKQAHLQKAVHLYQQAIEQSREAERAQLIVEQQRVWLCQGKNINHEISDTSLLAVTAAAMRADWLKMESLLDRRLSEASDAAALDVINTFLQYYLEVINDWRQVSLLMARGDKLIKSGKIPSGDPLFSRYNVLLQYIDLLKNAPVLDAEGAEQECTRRLQQVKELVTPEARVQAKGYLLLVRFYGDPVQVKGQKARRIYRDAAAEALNYAFDLLIQLAPLDQVDIMRTLATLPEWSSALVNEVTLSPGERSPLFLLLKSVSNNYTPTRETFLARLVRVTNLHIDAKLDVLRQQIQTSGADWPLLYTSFARLLAAFGRDAEARHFLEAPIANVDQTLFMSVLIAQDRAFLASWGQARRGITETIDRLRLQPGTFNNIIDELQLIRAYLSLDKGRTKREWRAALDHLTPSSFAAAINTRVWQDFHMLSAVRFIKLNDYYEAITALNAAANIMLSLGNTYDYATIQDIQRELLRKQREQQQQREEQSFYQDPENDFSPGMELALKQINDGTVQVNIAISQRRVEQSTPLKTRLEGIKRLLPQGSSFEALPDMDYWQKLLTPDSNQGCDLEQIGTTLLNDLLPTQVPERTLLNQRLLQVNQSLHITVQGEELECLPWSILRDASTRSWLSNSLRCSYNRPPQEPLRLHGWSVAIFPSIQRSDNRFGRLQHLYAREKEVSGWFYSRDLLRKSGPLPDIESSIGDLLGKVKLLHLVGDLSKLDDIEGVFLNVDTEHLTPDHLARRLRRLNISNGLIVLEPLSTGSNIEDVRVLLLRNSYAASLARLGAWPVLAVGPRHTSYTTRLVEQLLKKDPLTTNDLERMLQEARRITFSAGFDGLLEGMFELFYPELL